MLHVSRFHRIFINAQLVIAIYVKVIVDHSQVFKGFDDISKRAKQLEREASSFGIKTSAGAKQARIAETFLGARTKALREEEKINRATIQASQKRVESYRKIATLQDSIRRTQIQKEQQFQKSIENSNLALRRGGSPPRVRGKGR